MNNAIQFRMAAGFPGMVNRTHPANIEPALNDATNPILAFGLACLVNTSANSVRSILSSDSAITAIYGVLVRPYPFQDTGSGETYGAASWGTATPPAGACDVIREGYVMVPVVGSVTKGGNAYVWTAATSGSNVQGGFQAASSGSTSALLTNAQFNGPADSNGYAELVIRLLA